MSLDNPPNLERLLAPMPGESPTGATLRYDAVWDQIKEARREDDPSVPQGDWDSPLKKADWVEVERLCRSALETRSKDLQIAAWLTEAWAHRYGLPGVSQGLNLIRAYCESYWQELYPEIIDGDLEYRIAPFVWLDDKLSLTLRQIVKISDGQGADGGAYSLGDWESTLRMENMVRKNKQTSSDGYVSRAKFLASITLTPASFFHALIADAQTAYDAVAELEGVLEEKLAAANPGLKHLRQTMQAISSAAQEFVGKDSSEGEESDETGGAVVFSGRPIRSREEAYRRLSEAAEYLLKTEPHSPAPYLVKRAVAWGSMPLSELLEELVQSEGDLMSLYNLLGMRAM